ncbi:MAPEG family protein [Caulobacter hibisci]|uniref:MAPEG family protein n=1 Tax=Caulobacter hibisci TaxID=2035993 RepID=A0ABS0T3B1_9CAUL|nr:MAPEG family protein [Caulobacter hibisci]MBI1686380.1 MAPEG family protein [Caulobacter hibisci]
MVWLPITSVLCIASVAGLVGLSLPVALRRTRTRISLGEGGDAVLAGRMRAHGNFIEYMPLGLIAMGLAELQGAPTILVLASAIALGVGRLIHAIGMLTGAKVPPRAIGMVLTWLGLLGAGAGVLWAILGHG